MRERAALVCLPVFKLSLWYAFDVLGRVDEAAKLTFDVPPAAVLGEGPAKVRDWPNECKCELEAARLTKGEGGR